MRRQWLGWQHRPYGGSEEARLSRRRGVKRNKPHAALALNPGGVAGLLAMAANVFGAAWLAAAAYHQAKSGVA